MTADAIAQKPGQEVSYTREGDVAIITIDNPPVNALGQSVRRQLIEAVGRYAADDAKMAILMGAGRLFVGGADIKEFGKPPREPSLPATILAFESCEKPVMAAMHGAALGGGVELPLGCHYRIAAPGTKLGLPEVNIGLLPGAGGTQRLPRLTGMAEALKIIASGQPVTAEKALEIGMIDRIAEGDLRAAALAFAQKLIAAGAGPRRTGDLPRPSLDEAAVAATRKGLEASARGLVSPQASVDAVVASSRLDIAEGLAEERRLFMEMMTTPQRAGLIHAFFLERKAPQRPELAGVAVRTIVEIGVVGGGTMGAGIATAVLLAGYSARLVEVDAERAEKARTTITGYLDSALKRGRLSADDHAAILSRRLACVAGFETLASADLAIEAVFESMELKKEIFRKLDAVMKPGAVLATNTSYLDIDEIAAVTRRPQDVIGLHFFSPAHVMKLLEIVVADATAPDVAATAFALGKKLGKISVRAGVCDGFIGNRMLMRFRGAMDRLVLAGESPFQIDRALVDFGLALGPYAVGDLAGLDIGYMTRQRKADTRDPRDIVPVWADRLYELGRLGQKTGRGYYIYAERGRPGIPDPEVDAMLAAIRSEQGITPRRFAAEDIQRRYMAAMVNEAATLLEEGIADRPLDVDAVMLFGYGFPRHRGGPMHWADSVGLPGLLADIETWAQEDPYFWEPAPLLKRLVAEGSTFASLNG